MQSTTVYLRSSRTCATAFLFCLDAKLSAHHKYIYAYIIKCVRKLRLSPQALFKVNIQWGAVFVRMFHLLNYLTESDEMYLMFTLNWRRSLFGSTHVNDRGCDDLILRWIVRRYVVYMECWYGTDSGWCILYYLFQTFELYWYTTALVRFIPEVARRKLFLSVSAHCNLYFTQNPTPNL